ncbi:MAG: hypothetical protein AAFU56_04710 [Pseudomonadota bacterium]
MVFQRIFAFLSNSGGFTTLQAAGAFAVMALLAAIFVPGVYGEPGQRFAAFRGDPTTVDATITGSVEGKPKRTKRYTIRRSVLQKDPNKPCIIFEDGTREGGC